METYFIKVNISNEDAFLTITDRIRDFPRYCELETNTAEATFIVCEDEYNIRKIVDGITHLNDKDTLTIFKFENGIKSLVKTSIKFDMSFYNSPIEYALTEDRNWLKSLHLHRTSEE